MAKNSYGVDVLAASAGASKSVGIQVKTNRGGRAEDLQAGLVMHPILVEVFNGWRYRRWS